MFAQERANILELIEWNSLPRVPNKNESIRVIECWKYENNNSPVQGVNYRLLTLADQARERSVISNGVDDRLEEWLQWKNQYSSLQQPPNGGQCQGGIRLFVCDRPVSRMAMTISRRSYEAVEKAFSLHPATLPSFCAKQGVEYKTVERDAKSGKARRILITAKVAQKIEISNDLLSLSYDVQTGWTYAFLCGDGLIHERWGDQYYGSQRKQLVEAILAAPDLWDNPLLLPFCLLHKCICRIRVSSSINDVSMTGIENQLGATHAGGSGLLGDRDKWPLNVDPKQMTIALHSVFVQSTFIANSCNWAREYLNFLLALETDLQVEITGQRSWPEPQDLKDIILFYKSMLRGQTSNFDTFKSRANLQVNLLYNIINQQDSIQNRWDSRLTQLIARSTKQDSTSMTTFTFITALFLPGTFIATLFGMSMFHWQQASDSQLQSQAEDSDQSNVSNSFWIFWAITIPLTLFTMLGWYLWFRYANEKWNSELRTGLNLQDAITPMLPQSIPQVPLPFEEVGQAQPIIYPNTMDPRSSLGLEDTRQIASPMAAALKLGSNYQYNSFARWYETGQGTNIFALPATVEAWRTNGPDGDRNVIDIRNSLFTMEAAAKIKETC